MKVMMEISGNIREKLNNITTQKLIDNLIHPVQKAQKKDFQKKKKIS